MGKDWLILVKNSDLNKEYIQYPVEPTYNTHLHILCPFKCFFQLPLYFIFSIYFIKFDVTDKEGWNLMWDEAEKVLKGKIDILANNAGINPTVSLQSNSFFWFKRAVGPNLCHFKF